MGPHARTPRTHSQWVVGPGRTLERTRGWGWESARPRTPHTQTRGAPPGHPHAAPTARRSAHCGVGDGSPRPHPPHSQPVGSGPWPHARTDERSAVGERPSPDAPHQGKRRPARAPSCRPHSAQSLLPEARVVGLVTGPHARTPRTHTEARGAPPGHPHAAPTARKSPHCGVGDGSPRPHPPHPQPVGSGAHTHARAHSTWPARGGRGSAPPQTPLTTADGIPPGDALLPPPRRATPARKSARRGAGAGSPRLHQPHPGHIGRGTMAARPRGRAAGGGTAPDTRRPSQRWQATPPRGRPPTSPTARSPHRACRQRGQCWAPTPTHPRAQHVGSGPQLPAQWGGSQGRGSA